MIKISLGDKVETIDDAIKGKVIAIEGDTVTVKVEDGFHFEFNSSELILINTKDDLNTSEHFANHEVSEVLRQKSEIKRQQKPKLKSKDRNTPTFVVDLHIHHLTDSTKGMTNFDMLNLQLDTAKSQLEFAIKKRLLKMVFIHGVGEGVLKQELYTILRRYNNVNFYDADYKLYGVGATEVRIFQNTAP